MKFNDEILRYKKPNKRTLVTFLRNGTKPALFKGQIPVEKLREMGASSASYYVGKHVHSMWNANREVWKYVD